MTRPNAWVWNMTEDEEAGMRELVTEVNGLLYAGDRLNAIVDTVKALRKDPELAARRLGIRLHLQEVRARRRGSGNEYVSYSHLEIEELENPGLNQEIQVRDIYVSNWREHEK